MFKKNNKILIITPRFPIPTNGACEQDRLEGILKFKNLGYEIEVLTKIFQWQKRAEIEQFSQDNDIAIHSLPYHSEIKKSFLQKILFYTRRLINPMYWDGAAYEYSHDDIKLALKKILTDFQPDLVWFDYTYLWPLYNIVKKYNLPIVTRSINFEPRHFLDEDGDTLWNRIKSLPKYVSEYITIKASDLIFSITPKEEKIYKKLGARKVVNLPLRRLPALLVNERVIKDNNILHLFFMGASYNVPHSRHAADFIIREIAPIINIKLPGKFIFHIVGKKLPEDLSKRCKENIIEEGFIENLEEFLNNMDIALIPSLFGSGMQQKIFEPLARGIPTITSPRGLSDYPFKHREHLLLASTKDQYVEQIISLNDVQLRRLLSKNALTLCHDIFSQQVFNQKIIHELYLI